jgi:hypothetical protein
MWSAAVPARPDSLSAPISLLAQRQSLSQSLELCHTKPGSPLRARETILGWINQMGPCYLSTVSW